MRCPACTAPNPESARFCQSCGSPLDARRPLDGERKLVSVLFADVVGSTAIAEGLDPEQYAEVMDGAFAFMSDAVERYGGTVVRLMGDAVLAIFGAPVAHEDDADRAVRAGLMIRESAEEYARSLDPRYGIDFRVRIGINTGLVVAGEVGTGARMEYTAMGDTTNVAARLQTLAEPGTVLISPSTHRFVRGIFETSRRQNLALKGKSALVDAFVVHEPRLTAGSERGLEGTRTSLVGRDRERAILQAKVAALREGQGALVAIVGEVGLGKTRLIAEVRSSTVGSSRWVDARALSFGQSIAYAPWRQVIRALVGSPETDAAADTRERIRARGERLHLPEEFWRFLEILLGVESETTHAMMRELEGEVLVRRLVEAVREWCRAVAAEAPLVLVFDDLHWADSASLDLILEVAEVTRSAPLLTLCALRPDRDAPGWAFLSRVRDRLGERYGELVLEPLTSSEAGRLLGELVRAKAFPDGPRELVLRKSEGNPFFLEEVLRSLIDSGLLVRENDQWRATPDIESVAVPDTLVGVLSTRIDRLPEDTKRVVQTAAVLGRSFSRDVLSAVCAAAPAPEKVDDVGPHLEVLIDAELLYEQSRHPEWAYAFRHALTQQAAYELMLVRRRRALHGRVAGVLEALFPERRDELAPLLAQHYVQARQWEPAGEFSRLAGERALRLYALREAFDHYGRAVQVAEYLESTDPIRLVDAILELTYVGYALRRHEVAAEREEMLEQLRHAERIVREVDDRPRLGRVLLWQGNLYMLGGYPTESFPVLREGYQIAVETGNEELALAPLFTMTWFMADSDPLEARPRLRKVISDARRFARQPGAKELEAHALAVLGLAHARVGEFAEAEECVREALELAPHTRSPIKEADVEITVAMVYYEMGDFERGLHYSRSGTDHAQSVEGMECACTGTFMFGYGNLQLQRLEEARHAFEISSEMVAPLGPGMESERLRIHASLAFTRFSTGEKQSLAELENTLHKAVALGDQFATAFISHMVGDAYAQEGALDVALERYQAALDYYRSKGMTPAVARVLYSLAAAYDRQGRRVEGDRAHAEARTLQETLRARRAASLPAPSDSTP